MSAISSLVSINVAGSILIDSKLIVAKGHKYGLIGSNGSGKTTLLNYIVTTFPNHYPLLCSQEVQKSKKSALEIVMNADERVTLLKEESENENTTDERLAQVYEEMAILNTDADESRAKSILVGLGFTTEMINADSSTLSGGYRIRMCLAKALQLNPPLLLLDEPSNHLDLHAIIWLTNWLSKLKSTLIIVSHNIALIDTICDTIIVLENNSLKYHRGNYTAFKDKQKTITTKYKKLSFEKCLQLPKGPLITVDDVSFSYGRIQIFKNVRFGLYAQDKIALVGPNGVGKTTFLNLLNQTLVPSDGTITINRKIAIATFNQHSVDYLDLEKTCTEYLTTKYNILVQNAREALGKFKIEKKKQLAQIKHLSGGEKARVAFAELFCQRPDVLFLDEPTNNLDIETIEALCLGLQTYNSAIILISHDERFINEIQCQLYCVYNQKVSKYKGTFEEYKDYVLGV